MLGILADFFVADESESLRYAMSSEEPDEGEEIGRLLKPLEYKGITSLEIGTLWAILEGRKWDVKRHMPEDIYFEEDGEAMLQRFPDELTDILAGTDEETLARASVDWAKTEELRCNPEELRPLLNDLRALAIQANANGKSVYLWNCL